MILKKLEVKGHIALQNQTFEFELGKTGISGQPRAGKSSIFGLWTILFFGYEPNRKSRQMRGTVYDSFKGTDCFLAGEWICSDGLVRKEITINAFKRQSSIKIFLNGKILPGIEKSEIADTMTKKFLPFHEECYFSSIYLTQNNLQNLLSIDSRQRRAVFDKILRLEYWRNIYQRVAIKKKAFKKEFEQNKAELDNYIVPVLPAFNIEQYNQLKETLNSQEYKEYKLLLRELDLVKDRLLKVKNLSKEKEELDAYIQQDHKNHELHKEKMLEYSKQLTNYMQQEQRRSVIAFRLTQKPVDLQCGDFAKTCQLVKSVLTIEEEVKLRDELKTLSLLKPVMPVVQDLSKIIKSLQATINNAVDISEYEYLNKRNIELSYKLGFYSYPENIEETFSKMDYTCYQIAREKQKFILNRIEELEKKQKQLSRNIQRLQVIEDFASHTGIQAKILEAELPAFTNLTNEILNSAFPDIFSVDLKPDTMEIEITDMEKGVVSNLDSKSGFEKAIILEAMSCASLIQYGRSWNFIPTFIFRDEPTASMGEFSEKYMDMIDYIQKTFKIPQVFFISHDEACLSYSDNRICL